MSHRRSRPLHRSLQSAARRFASWRESRPRGVRIPEDLWDLAVGLAREHGVYGVSQALGLDYYSVKKRLEGAAEGLVVASPVASPAFVEVPFFAAPPVDGCVLEVEDGGGRRLRAELKGRALGEIGAVARALWEAAR